MMPSSTNLVYVCLVNEYEYIILTMGLGRCIKDQVEWVEHIKKHC